MKIYANCDTLTGNKWQTRQVDWPWMTLSWLAFYTLPTVWLNAYICICISYSCYLQHRQEPVIWDNCFKCCISLITLLWHLLAFWLFVKRPKDIDNPKLSDSQTKKQHRNSQDFLMNSNRLTPISRSLEDIATRTLVRIRKGSDYRETRTFFLKAYVVL